MAEFWCGDECAAQAYAVQTLRPPVDLTKLRENPQAHVSAFEPDRYWGTPAMAQMSGDTAIIKVSGSMIAGEAGWRRAFGYTGYEDLKGALVEAVGKAEVKSILLYMDTPGGMVNGVEGTARLIREVSKVKPVVAYAATAASAGYWLASAAEYIVADNTSMLGSLGSIIQLVNLVDAYAKDGIKFYTYKSGSLKMAGNDKEEMTEEASKYFQQQVEDMTAIFYAGIAKYRNMDVNTLRSDFGDGRSVLAARALAGGLIDEIGGTGEALRKVNELASQRSNVNLQAL